MKQKLLIAGAASVSLTTRAGDGVAFAQKAGGILRTYDPDSPGGLSIQEEATVFARGPMMGVFNNLIMYDRHVPQNSLASIVPDLATDWLWDEEGTALTFKLRQSVKFHDAAVLLIDQLKEIYIDGVLDAVDTTEWYPKVMRKDYPVGLTVSENGLNDPDQQFYENFVCGAERNYSGYCSPEVDRLVDQQSMQSDNVKRRELVWEIERRLAED